MDGLLWEGRKVEVSYAWNGQTLVPTRVTVDGTFADETEAHRIRQSGFGSGTSYTPHDTHDTRTTNANGGWWGCQACGMG